MGCKSSSERKQGPAAETTSQEPTFPVASYPSLPAGAVAVHCHHVYDGDTLTLQDTRRVRLLGLDTPELKEKEPFAEEARDFTKNYCHGKDIFIVPEGNGLPDEDKYGRLLRWIYVKDPTSNRFILVNEAIIAAGLAGFYHPDATPLHNEAQLKQLQMAALRSKKGKWSIFADQQVCVTSRGKCYHVATCEHLTAIRNLERLPKSEALGRGLSACRTCMGGTS